MLMNTNKTLSTVAAFAILAVTSVSAQTTINWASPSTGGLSVDANWEGGARPTASDQIANFGNATANRTVIAYNGGIGGLLLGIEFSQTSPFQNIVELRRNVGFTNAIVLGASGGGQVILRLDTALAAIASADTVDGGAYAAVAGASVRSLSAAGGITLNTGGALHLGKIINASGATIETVQLFNADTTIAGGELVVQNARKTGSGNATRVTYTASGVGKGNITMSSGKIEVGAAYTGSTSGTTITDTNLKLSGALTLTGGTTLLHLFSTTDAAKIVSATTITFGGDLVIDLASGALADGAVFKLFETTEGLTGDFASVTLSGISQSLASDGNGLWTTDYNGFNYAFSASTGNLSISTSQIPEPSAVALLAGISTLALVIGLRRLKR
ncbi:anchor protein [Opitutaceae bacterium TAV5]|nr:anchor protein [Opitutaceae bacterium TAV5]